MVLNLQPPDRPPTHQMHITVNASQSNLIRPQTVRYTPGAGGKGGNETTTRVSIVEMAPIEHNISSWVTIDRRGKKERPSLLARVASGLPPRPDLEVIRADLPGIPKLGRDINISLPSIPYEKLMPRGLPEEQAGELRTKVTIINATLPSFNRIEALNQPFYTPKNFTVGKRVGEKDGWGYRVTVEDRLTGGRGNATALFGAAAKPDAVGTVVKGLVMDSVVDAWNGAGRYCPVKCCPSCKRREAKTEYAALQLKCPPGCRLLDKGSTTCVCKTVLSGPCPAGKLPCEYSPGNRDLCIDQQLHRATCAPLGRVCMAKGLLPVCN